MLCPRVLTHKDQSSLSCCCSIISFQFIKNPELRVVVVLKNQVYSMQLEDYVAYTFDMLLMQSLRAHTYKVMPYFCLPWEKNKQKKNSDRFELTKQLLRNVIHCRLLVTKLPLLFCPEAVQENGSE